VHSELRVEKIDIVFAMQANSSVSACDSLRIVERIVVKVDDGDFRKYVNSFEFCRTTITVALNGYLHVFLRADVTECEVPSQTRLRNPVLKYYWRHPQRLYPD
jgi:hypothetical protein